MRKLKGALCLLIAALVAAGCGTDEAEPSAPAGSTLYLAGDGELWVVDPGSGRSRRFEMPQLRPGDPPHRIESRGDRLVLWGYDTWSLDPDRPDDPPERIARDSWIWIPSIHPDRVWVGYLDPEQRRSRGLRAVREIDSHGSLTIPDARPPDGAWPAVSLAAGLILDHRDDVVLLWDPRSGEIVRRMPRDTIGLVGPAHGNQLASCPDECETMVLTDFATGRQRSIPAPDGHTFEVWNGAFSQAGATIATTVRERGPGPDASKLALVSVASGEVRVIEGSGVPRGYTYVLWDGGDVLVASGGYSGYARLIRYSPSSDEVTRTSLEVGRFYDAAIGHAAAAARVDERDQQRKGLGGLLGFLARNTSTDGPSAVVGRSAQGRPIRAFAVGGLGGLKSSASRSPGTEERILVFGCIHGTECAGKAVAAALRDDLGCPPVSDVIVVPNLNPDGRKLGTRLNSRGVDLNRNFDADWTLAGEPGDSEYSGPKPFSEPETRLARRLVKRFRPDITIWFHQQDEPMVRAWGPSVPAAREYASWAGMPFRRLPWLRGTAPNWQNHALPGTSSFVVELPRGPLSRRAAWPPARAVALLDKPWDPAPARR